MQFTQRKWIREYFVFSQKERRAVIVLGALAILFALLPALFPFLVKDEIELVVDTATQQQLARLKVMPEAREYRKEEEQPDQLYEPKYPNFKKKENSIIAGKLFYFNPNTASAEDFQRLGLRKKTDLLFLQMGNYLEQLEAVNTLKDYSQFDYLALKLLLPILH